MKRSLWIPRVVLVGAIGVTGCGEGPIAPPPGGGGPPAELNLAGTWTGTVTDLTGSCQPESFSVDLSPGRDENPTSGPECRRSAAPSRLPVRAASPSRLPGRRRLVRKHHRAKAESRGRDRDVDPDHLWMAREAWRAASSWSAGSRCRSDRTMESAAIRGGQSRVGHGEDAQRQCHRADANDVLVGEGLWRFDPLVLNVTSRSCCPGPRASPRPRTPRCARGGARRWRRPGTRPRRDRGPTIVSPGRQRVAPPSPDQPARRLLPGHR